MRAKGKKSGWDTSDTAQWPSSFPLLSLQGSLVTESELKPDDMGALSYSPYMLVSWGREQKGKW